MEIAPIEETVTNGKFLDWTLIPDTTYTPNDIYQNGEVWNTTPVERISVVDLSTPVTIGTFTSNSAVKIYGAGNDNIKYGWNFTINISENNDKKYQLYIGVSAKGGNYDLAYVEINGTQIGSYTTSSGTLKNYSIPLELPAGDNVITVKYKKDASTNNQWVAYTGYVIDDTFPIGHGEKSVIMLQNIGLRLSIEEMLAIRYHMGAWDGALLTNDVKYAYNKALDECPLIVLLQNADNTSSLIFENKTN